MSRTTPFAVTVTALLVLTAFATFPVVSAATTVTVETVDATEVGCNEATLNGNLTTLSGADNATVWFEYWPEGEPADANQIGHQTLEEIGPFNTTVTNLEENTSYKFSAHAEANGSTANGSEKSFLTDEDCGPEEDNFGIWVSELVADLLNEDLDGPMGLFVASEVVENNPGADNRSDNANPLAGVPDDAGPPEDAGPDTSDDDEDDDEESDD